MLTIPCGKPTRSKRTRSSGSCLQLNSWPEAWPQQTIAWASLGRLIRPLQPSITLTSATHRGLWRSEEHTSELQSLMRNSYAAFCLKKKNNTHKHQTKEYDNKHKIQT